MISAWLSQHGHALLFTLQQLVAKPITHLCSVLAMGIALSLPLGVYTLTENLQSLSGQAASTPQMSLFVKIGTDSQDIAKIRHRLEADALIIDIQFIPKNVALQQLQQSSGLPDIATDLGRNPLPDAFVVHTRQETAAVLEQLRETMQNWPEIEWVQFDSDWIVRLNAMLDLGRFAVLMLSVLLSIAIVAIMFNTIRLQILIKHDEIEISKLIGATDRFIRRPFLYFGAIQGLAGGFTAWMIMTFAVSTLNQKLIDLTQLFDTDFQLQSIPVIDGMSLLFFAAWLGWLGARLSVASHLWQIAPK